MYNVEDFIEEIASYDAVTLEEDTFINFDMNTGIAKVDKDIFDCFVENSYIDIYCPDINANYIMQFTMVSEDEEGIIMEWIDNIRI